MLGKELLTSSTAHSVRPNRSGRSTVIKEASSGNPSTTPKRTGAGQLRHKGLKLQRSAANAPMPNGMDASTQTARVRGRSPVVARSIHASTKAIGYSATRVNNTGASSALNKPPNTPPTDMHR